MRTKVMHVSKTVFAAVGAALLATNVLSWQVADCPNLGGSASDQCWPCLACYQDSNGDWQNRYVNGGVPCNATVWNGNVTFNKMCGYQAYMVYIITQTGPGLVTALAQPQPVLNGACMNGSCIGTLGPYGSVTNMQVWGAETCPSVPPA